jgi:hypothetical protein
MKVSDFVAVCAGAAYFAFLWWLKKETERYNKALLNRMSDLQAATYPHVPVPGTEDVEDEVAQFRIKGLEDE